jgi:hypothetical protein
VHDVCTERSRKILLEPVWAGRNGTGRHYRPHGGIACHEEKTSRAGGGIPQGLLRASMECCQLYLKIEIPSSGSSTAKLIADVLGKAEFDSRAILVAVQQDVVKNRLKAVTEEAVKYGDARHGDGPRLRKITEKNSRSGKNSALCWIFVAVNPKWPGSRCCSWLSRTVRWRRFVQQTASYAASLESQFTRGRSQRSMQGW